MVYKVLLSTCSSKAHVTAGEREAWSKHTLHGGLPQHPRESYDSLGKTHLHELGLAEFGL